MSSIDCDVLPAFDAVVFDMDGLLLDSESTRWRPCRLPRWNRASTCPRSCASR